MGCGFDEVVLGQGDAVDTGHGGDVVIRQGVNDAGTLVGYTRFILLESS